VPPSIASVSSRTIASPGARARWASRQQIAREVEALERSGHVLGAMPGPRSLTAIGLCRASGGIDQNAGVEHSGGIQLGLGRPQRGGERRRTLAIKPRTVVAANRVMVGDRAAALDHRL
jgi:hypothetical protein